MDQSRQNEVTYELLEYFKETIGFNEKSTALINLLLIAPLHSLAGILEKHNVPLPEGFHDDVDVGSGEETPDSEDDEALEEKSIFHADGPDGSHGSRSSGISGREDSPGTGTVLTPTASGASTDAARRSRSSCTPRAARRNHPTPLRELIPSHQLRSDNIIQRARNFQLSNADAAASTQHHSGSGAAPLRSFLPARTRTIEMNASENGPTPSSGMPTMGRSYRRSLRLGGGGGRYSSITSRPELSGMRRDIRTDDPSEIRARGIGYLGELFAFSLQQKVFEMLSQKLNDWTFECWTSRLRSEAGYPSFMGHERDFSDFTYVDATGQMRAMLRDAGIDPNAAWSNVTKFHLEVKSTLGPCDEPMFVSQNQVDKMREYNGTANNAYILLRVFNLDEGGNTGIKFFGEPWSLYIDGVLKFRSDEGYKVYQ